MIMGENELAQHKLNQVQLCQLQALCHFPFPPISLKFGPKIEFWDLGP